MKGKINQVDNLVYEAVLTISPEELEQESRQQLRQISKKVSIPGFRKGKAPVDILKARYGKDVEEDAKLEVTNRRFSELMQTESYRIIGGGMIKSFNPQSDGSLEAVVQFQVEPEIELNKIDKLSVIRESYALDDADVNQAIENLRERHAVIEPVLDGASEDDYIMADFQEQDAAGTPIIGKKFEDRYFRLGSGVFGERFEQQLKGVKKDESRNVEVNYADKNNPGSDKREYYQVRVTRVEKKILPELNDEFARSLGDYPNLDALKETVKKEMTHELDSRSRDQLHQNLIDEVIKNNRFDVPPLMVDTYMQAWFEDVKKELKDDVDEQELKERNRPFAIRNIKWHLIRKKLIEQENLTATDDLIKAQIADFAAKSKIEIKEVEKYYSNPQRREKLKDQILDTLIFDRLLETAKVKEVEAKKKKSNLIETV